MEKRLSTNERNITEKISNFLDQNIRGVQYGFYTIGFTGLFIAFRSVRPKFSRPSSIPRNFIQRQVALIGQVKGADLSQGAAVLQIAHTPLLSFGRAGKAPFLPVELAGITPTQLGLSWLQITLNEQPISFTVISTKPQAVSARVNYQGKDVSVRLVELGFARLIPYDQTLEKSECYKKLYSELLRGERSAERHGNGIWQGSSPVYWRLTDKIISRLKLHAMQLKPRKYSILAVT